MRERLARLEGWLPLIATLLALVILSREVLSPVLPVFDTHYLGIEYVDHYGTQWFYWFADYSLSRGEQPGHTDLFFHPWGKDVFGHTGSNVLDAYLAIPFRRLFGAVLGYNLFLLAGVGVSALAFARLAREFTDDRLAIGVGSVLFAFTPYVLFEAAEGRPTQAILLFPVLFVLWTWRTGTRRSLGWPIAAGVALALTGYQYWYYAFFGGMMCLAHGLWRTARPVPDSGGSLRTLARHALIAAVAITLTLPVALPLFLLTQSGSSEIPGLLDTSRWTLRETPLETLEAMNVSLFVWQPFVRPAGAYMTDAMHAGVERYLVRIAWIPLVVYPMALLWLIRPGRLDRGPLLAMLVTLGLLSAGPLIIVGEYLLPNAIYIWIAKSVAFIQRLWWPGRGFAFMAILIGLLPVLGLAWSRRFGRWPQAGLATLLTIGWTAELYATNLAPYPAWEDNVPAGYRCLATGPEGALIELPYAWTQAHLYYQPVHERPILGGMIEDNPVFTPEESVELRENNSFVKALLELSTMQTTDPIWEPEDKQAVYDLGYRYVVLQKDAFHLEQSTKTLVDNALRTRLRRMQRRMHDVAGSPVYEDARVAVYAPWGDPPPCDPDTIEKDADKIGRTDKSTEELYGHIDSFQTLVRLFPASEEESEDDAALVDEAAALQQGAASP